MGTVVFFCSRESWKLCPKIKLIALKMEKFCSLHKEDNGYTGMINE